MRSHKVSIDFIQAGRCIGTWTDYVYDDSDIDGIIDTLYRNKLVNVNWDKVICEDRKPGKGDRIGWHRHYPPLQLKLSLMMLWLCIVFYFVVEHYSGNFVGLAVGTAWGWSWILYLGKNK